MSDLEKDYSDKLKSFKSIVGGMNNSLIRAVWNAGNAVGKTKEKVIEDIMTIFSNERNREVTLEALGNLRLKLAKVIEGRPLYVVELSSIQLQNSNNNSYKQIFGHFTECSNAEYAKFLIRHLKAVVREYDLDLNIAINDTINVLKSRGIDGLDDKTVNDLLTTPDPKPITNNVISLRGEAKS